MPDYLHSQEEVAHHVPAVLIERGMHGSDSGRVQLSATSYRTVLFREQRRSDAAAQATAACVAPASSLAKLDVDEGAPFSIDRQLSLEQVFLRRLFLACLCFAARRRA